MSAGTWTILGLGNFVWDVIDTIESRGGVVERVVLNVHVDPGLVARLPDGVEIVRIDDFRPPSAHHCFGRSLPARLRLRHPSACRTAPITSSTSSSLSRAESGSERVRSLIQVAFGKSSGRCPNRRA